MNNPAVAAEYIAESINDANSRLYSITQEISLLSDLVGAIPQSNFASVGVEALSVGLNQLAERTASVHRLIEDLVPIVDDLEPGELINSDQVAL